MLSVQTGRVQVQSELAEGAVLDVDGAIVELNSSNGKIPVELRKTGVPSEILTRALMVATLKAFIFC